MAGRGGNEGMGARIVQAVIRRVAPNLAREMEANRDVRDWVMPRESRHRDPSPHVPGRLLGHAGLDLRLADQLDRLARWRESYPRVFDDLRRDPRINTQCPGKPYVHNGTYPTPDAEIYAAMILDFRPRRIVEIGAGFQIITAGSPRAGKAKLEAFLPAPLRIEHKAQERYSLSNRTQTAGGMNGQPPAGQAVLTGLFHRQSRASKA